MQITRWNSVLTSEGNNTIVIYDENLSAHTITETHPNFVRILSGLQAEEDVSEWLDGSQIKVLATLSDRVSIEDDVLHFDGDPVYDGLSQTILRYRREGRDVANLVKFMERLAENPSRRSREQLFTWTQAKDLVIDPEGYIIAFKGVTSDMLSIHSGTAYVDGEKVDGHIPNMVGTVITMPRSQVQDDPNKGCSHGLHAGNWSYASSFGYVILEVRIDPADVVSVPSDCAYQKLRSCRYEVVAVHETDEGDLDEYEPESTWDEEEAMDEWDSFVEYAPPSFMQRLRDRLTGRNKDS
jgi:hypothetical protein